MYSVKESVVSLHLILVFFGCRTLTCAFAMYILVELYYFRLGEIFVVGLWKVCVVI